jgi:sugar lactone lactonase YvrE
MNDRVQILDQEGGFIDIWKQFGRTGGIYIDRATDTLYVSDANSTERNHPGWPRGIRVASASNGAVRYFISGSEPEGVAGDARGNVYAAVTRGIVEKFEKLER